MVATASAVRYAPEDHSLPKPWKGLVDDRTGYLYFWNPETNVTQYERPAASSSQPPPKLPSVPAQHTNGSSSYLPAKDDDVQYRRGSSDLGPKVDSASRFSEVARSGAPYSNGGLGNSAKGPSSAPGNDISPEAYCFRHEITVSGGQVPPPLMSFETTGFPPELLREVRCLLLGGANVVHCTTSLRSLQNIWSGLYGGPNFLERASKVMQACLLTV